MSIFPPFRGRTAVVGLPPRLQSTRRQRHKWHDEESASFSIRVDTPRCQPCQQTCRLRTGSSCGIWHRHKRVWQWITPKPYQISFFRRRHTVASPQLDHVCQPVAPSFQASCIGLIRYYGRDREGSTQHHRQTSHPIGSIRADQCFPSLPPRCPPRPGPPIPRLISHLSRVHTLTAGSVFCTGATHDYGTKTKEPKEGRC